MSIPGFKAQWNLKDYSPYCGVCGRNWKDVEVCCDSGYEYDHTLSIGVHKNGFCKKCCRAHSTILYLSRSWTELELAGALRWISHARVWLELQANSKDLNHNHDRFYVTLDALEILKRLQSEVAKEFIAFRKNS